MAHGDVPGSVEHSEVGQNPARDREFRRSIAWQTRTRFPLASFALAPFALAPCPLAPCPLFYFHGITET